MFTNEFQAVRALFAMILTTAVLMTLAFLWAATGQFDPLISGLLAGVAALSLIAVVGRHEQDGSRNWQQAATVAGAAALLVVGAAGGILVA